MKKIQMPEFSRTAKIALGILIALGVLGLVSYGYQFVVGLGATGLNNGVSWGLYIAMFLFCEGLASGCMIMATSGFVFKNPRLERCALPGALLALIFMSLAGVFVTLDLGNIMHILNLIIHLNVVSPLAWDIISITSFLIVTVVFIGTLLTGKKHTALRNESAHIAFVLSVVVPTVAAFIFAVHAGREGWHSAIMPPLFVASGLDSGLALLIVALLGLNRTGVYKVQKSLIDTLSGILVMFIAADAFMIVSELVIMAYPQVPQDARLLHEMTQGSVAGYFWIEMIVGLIIPLGLLLFSRLRTHTMVVFVSSIAVIAGVFCKRMWLTITSFIHPQIEGAPGLISASPHAQTGMDVFSVSASYVPQMPEIMLAVGMMSLGVAAFILLSATIMPWYEQRECK